MRQISVLVACCVVWLSGPLLAQPAEERVRLHVLLSGEEGAPSPADIVENWDFSSPPPTSGFEFQMSEARNSCTPSAAERSVNSAADRPGPPGALGTTGCSKRSTRINVLCHGRDKCPIRYPADFSTIDSPDVVPLTHWPFYPFTPFALQPVHRSPASHEP